MNRVPDRGNPGGRRESRKRDRLSCHGCCSADALAICHSDRTPRTALLLRQGYDELISNLSPVSVVDRLDRYYLV
jgi:hypothetical protein